MRVVITGGTGMIGSLVAARLRARGDDVFVVTRREPKSPHELRWDPASGKIDEKAFDGMDAVVNLAGAPIADRPWTKARRQLLRESRVDVTNLLHEALGKLAKPPRVFVGAGGLGRFGNRGEELLDDDAGPGTGFLAELALAWEDAHLGARKYGARAVALRMPSVLSATGGAFPLMVKPFRLGLGGWLGPGNQYTPWITARDAVSGFVFALDDARVDGCLNLTVPEPPSNYDWCKALGRALHRPVLMQAPRWALRGAFGELADDLLLASVRAVPKRLLSYGFAFQDTDSFAAFTHLLAEYDAPRAR